MELLKAEVLDEKYVVVNGLNTRYIVRGCGSGLRKLWGLGVPA